MGKTEALFAAALLITLSLLIRMFPIRPSDYILYNQLLQSSQPAEATSLPISHHTREGVKKQMWLYEAREPIYCCITSQHSSLSFAREDSSFRVSEQMEGVECIMQQSLQKAEEEPRHRIQYVKADRADYDYRTRLFVAHTVSFWQYLVDQDIALLPCAAPSYLPFMQASASTFSCTLQGTKIDCVAYHLHASINSQEKM